MCYRYLYTSRDANCQSWTFASHRPCAAVRAQRVWRRIRCTGQAWMEFVFPWIDTSQKVSTTTKAQVRLEKYTADELLLHGTHPLGFTRYTVHARIYRVSMLHELGANVPIQSRCGASPATPRREIDCITGRLLAAEHSSRTLVPFHDSLGSHCPLRGS